MNATKISLKNMQFYGYHGVYDSEKELGQIYEVDVELKGDFIKAGYSDDLALTVNYAEVYEMVKNFVEGDSFDLVEALGVSIADQLMEKFSLEQVVVRVRKPNPPLGGVVGAAEFEVVKDCQRVRIVK